MHRRKRIADLMTKLQSMLENELLSTINSLDISVFMFQENFNELERIIHAITSSDEARHLYFLRNKDQLRLGMKHILRLLHNFVASAQSLIDHTRRLYGKLYQPDNSFPDYNSRVESEFANDPLSQFVKCLRQYCQHYKAPDISIISSWQDLQHPPKRAALLLKRDLLAFDGWTTQARRFLQSAPDEMEIIQITKDYRDKVMSFHQWFRDRQLQIHAAEMQTIATVRNEAITLMFEDRLESALAPHPSNDPTEPDEIFLSVFTSSEFAELEEFPLDSEVRAHHAIRLLKNHFSVPEHLQHLIIRWYKEKSPKLKNSQGKS